MALSAQERKKLNQLAAKVRTFNESSDGSLLARVSQGIDDISSITVLTDNSGGTANDTLEDSSTPVTGVDGTGSNAASKADVDARLVSISNNLADLSAKINEILNTLNG